MTNYKTLGLDSRKKNLLTLMEDVIAILMKDTESRHINKTHNTLQSHFSWINKQTKNR